MPGAPPARAPSLGHVVVALFGLLASACGEEPLRWARAEPTAPAASEATPRPDGALRVGTLNVWAIPFVSEETAARLERLGPAVRAWAPDVLCFQEVFSDGARAALLAGLGPDHHATPGAPGGLLVLSRLPIARHAFTPFPPYAGLDLPERLAAKGFLTVELVTDAGHVRVVNAHLALAFGDGNPRSRQLRYLLDHLEGRKDLATVIAADLNTPAVVDGARTDDYLSILDRGWKPAEPLRQREDGTWRPPTPTRIGWPRTPDPRRAYHPDHVLFRDGVAVTFALRAYHVTLDTPETAVSDHNLVVADLEVARR